jgi:RNA polymerase sigma-70 factor (ECF subfamily)
MQHFLSSIEGRAFSMAQFATKNREDALDIVQDAMFKLVQKYSAHPAEQWKPLFYSILQTRILDWHRRQSVHNRFRSWLHWNDGSDDEDETENPIEQVASAPQASPDIALQDAQFSEGLNKALNILPLRQQQVFLLRVWEGMDIAETAKIMQCSESSVKTHYARALEKLKLQLGAHR